MNQRFQNQHAHAAHSVVDILKWKLGLIPRDRHDAADDGLPDAVAPDHDAIASPAPDSIQITWIGHASFLIQMGGLSILVDPVYARYCSPVPLPGLRRLQPPGIPWQNLPRIDAVLITHNHYDHLDVSVVRKLAASTLFIVPDGLENWMTRHGVDRVVPMAWWQQETVLDELKVTSCPTQHFSARTPFDRNRSHWCGWLIEWRGKKIYHAGDSGYCPHFKEIGQRLGPMDVALIPIGAYAPRSVMEAVHITPEEAVDVHHDVRSKLSLACHWGTYQLTDEPVMEPARRLQACKEKRGIPDQAFRVLPIGGAVTVPAGRPTS